MNLRIANYHGALGAAVAVLLAAPAAAEVVQGQVTGGSSGGTFQLIAAPAAIGPDSLQSPDLFAFDELQNVELLAPLPLRPGVVAGAGSVLSSHYVAFDPDSGSTLEGQIAFDEPIVGILGGPQLGASTPLFGLDGTTYTGSPAIGPEPNDELIIAGPQRNRLLIRFAANSPGDHFRVLTGTVVPEPAAWLLSLVASLGAVANRRWQRLDP